MSFQPMWLVSFRGELNDAARAALSGVSVDVQGRNISHGHPNLNHVQIAAPSDSDALEVVMDAIKAHGMYDDWQVTELSSEPG